MADTMTEEEKRKFWEACGLVHRNNPVEVSNFCEAMCMDTPVNGWYSPEGKLISLKVIPDFTLDNLFKYAVPILHKKYTLLYIEFDAPYKPMQEDWICNIRSDYEPPKLSILGKGKTPALALRDAIWQVLKRKK